MSGAGVLPTRRPALKTGLGGCSPSDPRQTSALTGKQRDGCEGRRPEFDRLWVLQLIFSHYIGIANDEASFTRSAWRRVSVLANTFRRCVFTVLNSTFSKRA